MPKKRIERIILVNPDDKKIGLIEKILAHQYGMLHRAFSVFIFRKKNKKIEVLLQQRSKIKYHGGGLWTNTCCSHPHPGERLIQAAKKRLKEEMGIEAALFPVGKFHYIAKLDHGMVENEMDHVFIGFDNSDHIPFNPVEVENYQWVNIKMLQKKLKTHPHRFTPWLAQALQLALKSPYLSSF